MGKKMGNIYKMGSLSKKKNRRDQFKKGTKKGKKSTGSEGDIINR